LINTLNILFNNNKLKLLLLLMLYLCLFLWAMRLCLEIWD